MIITSPPMTGLAQLDIDTRTQSPTTVCVAVAGELDLANAAVLRARLLEVIHDQAPRAIDVDLAEVSFLDCAGLGALVAARNTAVYTGCHLRVTHPRPNVLQVLKLTGLLGLLTAPPDQQHPTASAIPDGPARGARVDQPGRAVSR